jgi:hypothetical protein
MKQLTELISSFWQKPLKVRKIKNEDQAIRADWIDQCAKLTKRPYVQLASLFASYPTSFIKDLYLKANEFKTNPQAYFWKLWNENK